MAIVEHARCYFVISSSGNLKAVTRIPAPNYDCIYLDVGTNGRINDAGVWNEMVVMPLL